MDQNSSLPDDLLMAMLPYGADATNTYPLNSEDCLDPRELCNSLYAPTAHENASWPSPNDGALDDVSTQWNVLQLDSYIDFNSGSLANDLNIPSTMQLASNTLTAPCYEEHPSFDPSPIPSRKIEVKKGDNKCPHCSTQFKGGAAAVRKHIKLVHIKKEQIEGEVVRSTPGRAKTRTIPEDIMRLATKRRRIDGDDARAYLPLATPKRFEEMPHITVHEFRNIQKDFIKLQHQYADLQVFAMRLQAGTNNQSHDILARFDKSFEKYLVVSLKNMTMTSPANLESDAWYKQTSGHFDSLLNAILARYPKEKSRYTLEYAIVTLEWSYPYENSTFQWESKYEKEKAVRAELSWQITIDMGRFDKLSRIIHDTQDSGRSKLCGEIFLDKERGCSSHTEK